MKTKRTTFAAFLAAGFTVPAAVVLFATSAAASAVSGPGDRVTSGDSRTGAAGRCMTGKAWGFFGGRGG